RVSGQWRLLRSRQDRHASAAGRGLHPDPPEPPVHLPGRRPGQEPPDARRQPAAALPPRLSIPRARLDAPPLRAALAASLIALAASLVAASPALDPLRGLSIDILTALRWRIYGNSQPPEASPAVVVALDEETFRTPPFDGTPTVTWTREIAEVLTAIIDGGARVVGFDIIFPTSIEQSAVPFGERTLGARVRGFDRDYLRALALGARAGKVVLGDLQHQDRP